MIKQSEKEDYKYFDVRIQWNSAEGNERTENGIFPKTKIGVALKMTRQYKNQEVKRWMIASHQDIAIIIN